MWKIPNIPMGTIHITDAFMRTIHAATDRYGNVVLLFYALVLVSFIASMLGMALVPVEERHLVNGTNRKFATCFAIFVVSSIAMIVSVVIGFFIV